DSDHDATVDLVKSLPFSALHVFPYSPRPGTAALRIAEQVEHKVTSRRAEERRALAAGKSAGYAARRIGGAADVIAVGKGAGLTEDYLSVSIADHRIPRRARFDATLGMNGGRLLALAE